MCRRSRRRFWTFAPARERFIMWTYSIASRQKINKKNRSYYYYCVHVAAARTTSKRERERKPWWVVGWYITAHHSSLSETVTKKKIKIKFTASIRRVPFLSPNESKIKYFKKKKKKEPNSTLIRSPPKIIMHIISCPPEDSQISFWFNHAALYYILKYK